MYGYPVTRIQATGGFARSDVWRQMMSDIFASEVVVPKSYESSCLGACILGLYATGKIDSFEIVSEMVGSTYKHTPKEEATKEYRQLLPIFINLSRALEDDYTRIANYQKKFNKVKLSSVISTPRFYINLEVGALLPTNRGINTNTAKIRGTTMPLVIVAIGILALLLLIMRFKLNTFISLIIVSVGVALALGMPPEKIFKTIEAGLGGTLGHLALVFGLGAMLGKLLSDSGVHNALP